MDRFERSNSSVIAGEWEQVVKEAPFGLVTALEVFEDLSADELDEALTRFRDVLSSGGLALLSMPIEIRAALVIKEINRAINFGWFEYTPMKLIGACILGRPGRRARDIKPSHKGLQWTPSEALAGTWT